LESPKKTPFPSSSLTKRLCYGNMSTSRTIGWAGSHPSNSDNIQEGKTHRCRSEVFARSPRKTRESEHYRPLALSPKLYRN
jgi:hypothetical protein